MRTHRRFLRPPSARVEDTIELDAEQWREIQLLRVKEEYFDRHARRLDRLSNLFSLGVIVLMPETLAGWDWVVGCLDHEQRIHPVQMGRGAPPKNVMTLPGVATLFISATLFEQLNRALDEINLEDTQ